MRAGVLALCLSVAAGTAAAQTDDRDYLTAFLEDSLSDAGRTVTITGFAGALSSRATVQRIEIADAKGVWITLDGVVLDWSRSSLLSGQVVVNELTADSIVLERWPETDDGLPDPEARGFSLPELPVSVQIGEVAAQQLRLGAGVLGQPVEGTVTAAASLAGGEGEISVDLVRTDDGPDGSVTLRTSYSNASRQLVVALEAREEAGGIAASLLGLPGQPSAALSLKGKGTPDDFNAAFRLESDGVERLAGPITLKLAGDGAHAFSARLAGNPAPLFLPAYADFLGDRVALDVSGQRFPSGRVRLEGVHLSAQALDLDGTFDIAGDGLPEAFDVTARVAQADGTPVALPLTGAGVTQVRRAEIALTFDQATDTGWTGRAVLDDLTSPGLAASRTELKGSGRIDRTAGRNTVGGTLDFVLAGAVPNDPALATALGSDVTGKAVFSWREGRDALALPQLSLTGTGYAATAALTIEGLATGLRTSGWVEARVADFARFSGLAGRPLAGAGTVRLDGNASPLGGAFDLAIAARTQGLALGQPQADRLLADESRLTASVRRDETGTQLRALDFGAASLKLAAAGRLSSAGNALTGTIDIGSLADISPGFGGSLSAAARFDGDLSNAVIGLEGTGRGLRLGQPQIDRVLAGDTRLTAGLRLLDGALQLQSLNLGGPNLALMAQGNGGGSLKLDGRLRDLRLLANEFSGPVTVTGSVAPRGAVQAVDLRLTGPAGISARVTGLAGATADLAIDGTAAAAVANGFIDPVALDGAVAYDLRLAGPWALSSLSGRVTLAGGKVAVPARGLSLNRVALAADLSGGRARISATGEGGRGGTLRVDGPVDLRPPFAGDLNLRLDAVRLRDPQLYETTLSGALALSGPLKGRARLSGELDLGVTELRIPSTGFATAAELDAVRHVNDPADVRETRARAGVGGAGQGRSGAGLPDWLLDVTLSAPSRVFLRGRGLDAELGGSVRLGGSLRAIVPAGGLELIRGRLDILGKRLVLSEASLALEGDFVPFLRVSASNETESVVSTVAIEGPADAPEVRFSSNPELPQEEVLSWLLFGRGLETLSAFQAAQLANAVAVLAGRGGEGIVGTLRKGFGFDDLDVATDQDGGLSVRAGKYVSEKLYTEIGVDETGQSRINLNLDLRRGVTVKGRVDSDGDSGIGVFLEKDY